jgi:hypothetical protein
MVKDFPKLDDGEMANLLIEHFYFTENSNWHSIVDLVQTIRKSLQ